MKNLILLALGLVVCFFPAAVFAAAGDTPMPDDALEAAVEAIIGDDSVPDAVDGELLATDLTFLGLDESGINPVSGVTDLTGLEGADSLLLIFLADSPVASFSPVKNLPSLVGLGLIDCAVTDADITELISGDINLSVLYLPNLIGGANVNNVTQTGLAALAAEWTGLTELQITDHGSDFDISVLAGLPLGTVEGLDIVSLGLSGNTITAGLPTLEGFTAATKIDIGNTGLDNTELDSVDWTKLTALTALYLYGNSISEITPLRDMVGVQTGLTVDLSNLPLSETAVCTDVPYLVETGGFTVVAEGVDPCGPELTVNITGTGTASQVGTRRQVQDSVVTITAFPTDGSGYAFQEWTGDVTGTSPEIQVTMDGAKTITAVFVNTGNLSTITVQHAGSGSGTTDPSPGVYTYLEGAPLNLFASPDSGSFFGGWTVTIGADSFPVSYYSFPVEAVPEDDALVVATFTDSGYDLILDVDGNGQVLPSAGTYAYADGYTVEPLQANPAEGWYFAGWDDGTGNIIDTDNPTLVVMTGDVTRKAVFLPNPTSSLTMIKAGTGNGTTTPASDVTPGLSYPYVVGVNVELTAEPDANSVFLGWSGDIPAGVDATARSITVTMDQDRAITANFVQADWQLTVQVVGTGDTTPTPGTYGYLNGAVVDLGVILDEGSGFAFEAWSGDFPAESDLSLPDQTLTMDGNKTVTATFTDSGTISLTVSTSGAGTGTTDPAPGTYSYLPGQLISLTQIPGAGSFFGGWTGQEETSPGVWEPIGITFVQTNLTAEITKNTQLTANFGTDGFTIVVLPPDVEGGVFPDPGTYLLATGTQFTLFSDPAPGWNFVEWQDGSGNVLSSDTELPVVVDADKTFKPVYELPSFTLTMISAGTGTGTTSPVSSAAPGTDYQIVRDQFLVLTATPSPTSVFSGWSGDLPPGADPANPILNVIMSQDRVITATFAPADYTLTVQVAGTTNPVDVYPAPGQYGFLSGQQITLRAMPANGSIAAFDLWTGSIADSQPIVTLTMNGNKTVIANYVDTDASNSKQLTVLASEGPGTGLVFPLGEGVYRFLTNRQVMFAANPLPGSYFNGWRGDYNGVNTPQELAVRMSQDRTLGAAFSTTGANVTVAVSGQGDVFPRPGVYALADGLAVPFTGSRINSTWVFDSWQDIGGNPYSSDNPYTLVVDASQVTQYIEGVFAEDVTAPEVIACAPDTVLEPDQGCVWALPDYTTAVDATDDYGPITILQDPLAGTVITGTTLVTITVKDMSTASPNTTCTFTVEQVDTLGNCLGGAYNVDQDGDQSLNLTELMRIIQFYNTTGGSYHCAADPSSTEDGFVPGLDAGAQSCTPSAADKDGDFVISLAELLRVIQLFNAEGFFFCGDQSPDGDGVCAGEAARVRVVHASPTTPDFDLCANGVLRFVDVAYGTGSVYTSLPENAANDFRLVLAGNDCGDTPLYQLNLGLLAGESATIAPAGAGDIFAFLDDTTPPAAGKAKVRLLHLNTAAVVVDVVALLAGGGELTLFDDVSYGSASAYVEVDPGLYTLQARAADGVTPVAPAFQATLAADTTYSVAAAGDGTSPFLPVLLEE